MWGQRALLSGWMGTTASTWALRHQTLGVLAAGVHQTQASVVPQCQASVRIPAALPVAQLWKHASWTPTPAQSPAPLPGPGEPFQRGCLPVQLQELLVSEQQSVYAWVMQQWPVWSAEAALAAV